MNIRLHSFAEIEFCILCSTKLDHCGCYAKISYIFIGKLRQSAKDIAHFHDFLNKYNKTLIELIITIADHYIWLLYSLHSVFTANVIVQCFIKCCRGTSTTDQNAKGLYGVYAAQCMPDLVDFCIIKCPMRLCRLKTENTRRLTL